jgi:hypothetical protein
MSQLTVTSAASQQTATPGVSHQIAWLLTAGIVAGPLFLAVWALQAFTRDGFDPGRHPISLLSLGQLGWIQIANFVVTGALLVGCAVGLRHVLHRGRGGTWGPWLVGAFGAGLILAGVLVTDAGAGFPSGAPAGAPKLARRPARGRLPRGAGVVDGGLPGVPRSLRRPRAAGLGPSVRRDRGGVPRAQRMARLEQPQHPHRDRDGGAVRVGGGCGGTPQAGASTGDHHAWRVVASGTRRDLPARCCASIRQHTETGRSRLA